METEQASIPLPISIRITSWDTELQCYEKSGKFMYGNNLQLAGTPLDGIVTGCVVNFDDNQAGIAPVYDSKKNRLSVNLPYALYADYLRVLQSGAGVTVKADNADNGNLNVRIIASGTLRQ